MSEYKIPEDLDDIFTECFAAEKLMNLYSKRPFGYTKALKASKLAVKKRREFWDKVYALYPAVQNKGETYDRQTLLISIEENKQSDK